MTRTNSGLRSRAARMSRHDRRGSRRRLTPTLLFLLAAATGAPASAQEMAAPEPYTGFGETVAWPAEAFYEGETPAMIAEAKAHLRFFAYDVGYDRPVNPESEEERLRSQIRAAHIRAQLPYSSAATPALLDFLRDARAAERFPCPSPEQADAPAPDDDGGETLSITFIFNGPRPALYLAQLFDRLYQCAPDAFPARVAPVPDGASVMDVLFAATTQPPADDEAAQRYLANFASRLSLKVDAPPGMLVVPDVKVDVNAHRTLFVKVNKADSLSAGKLVLADPYTTTEPAGFCAGLGYASSCLDAPQNMKAMEEVEEGNGAVEWVRIPHFNIELEIDLPQAGAGAYAEDLYRTLIYLNPPLRNSPANAPAYAATAARSGQRLGPGGSQKLTKAAQETLDRLKKEVGWPTEHTSAGCSSGNDCHKIRLFDGSLFDDRVEKAREVLMNEKNDEENKTVVTPLQLEHGYFSDNDRPEIEEITDAVPDAGKPDPGHALFALGLLVGDWGFGHLGGWATDTSDAFVANVQTIKADLGDGQFKEGAHTNVLITDGNFHLPDSDEGESFIDSMMKGFTEIFQNGIDDEEPSDRLLIIAAPYRHICKSENGTETCRQATEQQLNNNLDAGGDWGCYKPSNENDQYTRKPAACLAAHNSNHAIIVASANQELDGMFGGHFRLKKRRREDGFVAEHYLAAPGCELISADVQLDANGEKLLKRGVRQRGCGSSYAAPVVAALVSRLRTAGGPLNDDTTKAIDIKTLLLATSNLATGAGMEHLYGVVNWTRTLKTFAHSEGFKFINIWFDDPSAIDDDPGAGKLCECFFAGKTKDW